METKNSSTGANGEQKLRTMQKDIKELAEKREAPSVVPTAKFAPIPKPTAAAPEIKIAEKPAEKISPVVKTMAKDIEKEKSEKELISEIEKIEKEKAAIEKPPARIFGASLELEKLPVEKAGIEKPGIRAIPKLEIPPEPESPVLETMEKIKPMFKIVAIALPIILILGLGLGLIVYYLSPPKSPAEPKIPSALFAVDKIKIINLDKADRLILAEKINEAALREGTENFSQLLVKKSEQICLKLKKECTKKHSYLSLAEIYEIMQTTPPQFLQNLKPEQATLFVYQDAEGPKFGIVAEPENIASAQNELEQIEKEFSNYLFEFMRPEDLTPAFESFKTTSYKNTVIKYNNYPTPQQAIDYAIYTPSDYILIATSKNSMFDLIDRLTETITE